MITMTFAISTRIVISCAIKIDITFVFEGKSMETETTTSEFPNGGKAAVGQLLGSEEINNSKRAGLLESQSEILVGTLTI